MIDPIHNQAYQEYSRVSGQKSANGNGEKFSLDVSTDASTDPSLNGNSSDHSKDGVIYEPGNRSETANKESASGKQTGYGSASANSNSLSTQSRNTTRSRAGSTESLTDTVRRLWKTALQAVKKFLLSIWESKPAEGEESLENNPELEDAAYLDNNLISEAAASLDDDLISEEAASLDDGLISEDAAYLDDNLISEADATLQSDSAFRTGPRDSAAVSDPMLLTDETLDQDIRKALKSGDTDTFRALLSRDGSRLPAKSTSLLTYYDASGRLVMPDPSDQYRILHGDRGSRKS